MVLGPGFGFYRALLVGKRPVKGLEETATKIVPISSSGLWTLEMSLVRRSCHVAFNTIVPAIRS